MASSKVWVISGPSGVGKGTVCAELQRQHPEAFYSVSVTTRSPRPGEVPGRSYHFITDAEFDALTAEGGLLESATVHGKHRYGTPKQPVVSALARGEVVVLEIDLQGAEQVKQSLPEAQLVFLMPPSMQELETRLRGRGTEDLETQQVRLATARSELASSGTADYVVVNDEIASTVAALVDLLGL